MPLWRSERVPAPAPPVTPAPTSPSSFDTVLRALESARPTDWRVSLGVTPVGQPRLTFQVGGNTGPPTPPTLPPQPGRFSGLRRLSFRPRSSTSSIAIPSPPPSKAATKPASLLPELPPLLLNPAEKEGVPSTEPDEGPSILGIPIRSRGNSLKSVFSSAKTMRGSNLILSVPIEEFCENAYGLTQAGAGRVIELRRKKDVGTIGHEFLILEALTSDMDRLFIRLDRRPVNEPGVGRLLVISSKKTASDSVLFAASENALRAFPSETTTEEARIQFLNKIPTIKDLARILYAVHLEAPHYDLKKENCWFFASIIEELLVTQYNGVYQAGGLAHITLAEPTRKKIRTRMIAG